MFDDTSELQASKAVRGRASGSMTKGRFERHETVYAQEEARQFETEVFKDTSRSIISFNDSPDVGFNASLNAYRGCEHGCIYCYARPTHEYLGLSAGLDFETKIFAKMDAPQLLRTALNAKGWVPQPLGMSGVTDCYQPIERKLRITRGCLEVLAEFRNPVAIITKNILILRDLDLLSELARYSAVHVSISLTTLDKDIARRMEPRASQPQLRLKAIEQLSKAGIPVSVNLSPMVPGLTDSEIPALMEAAASAGAQRAHYNIVRLPYGVKDLFQTWLEENFPLKKLKVLSRIRELRGGKLYNAEFGSRMKGEGVYAEQLGQLFYSTRKRLGLDRPFTALSTEHFRRMQEKQLALF